MSTLRLVEKIKLEKFFEMGGGYVCDFTNARFAEFFDEVVGIDIYDDQYKLGLSGSKATRLREFWKRASNEISAELTDEMLEYWKSQLISGHPHGHGPFNAALYNECKKITARLLASPEIEAASALIPNSSDKEFHLLAESIKRSLGRGEFSPALDRLHTFLVKYLRNLNNRVGKEFDKNTSLNSLMGAYVKAVREEGLIESEMTKEILSGAIRELGTFDKVRNDHSLAHDNPLLNTEESQLIFGHVSNTIRFLESLEKTRLSREQQDDKTEEPFTNEEIEAAFDAAVASEVDRRLGK